MQGLRLLLYRWAGYGYYVIERRGYYVIDVALGIIGRHPLMERGVHGGQTLLVELFAQNTKSLWLEITWL